MVSGTTTVNTTASAKTVSTTPLSKAADVKEAKADKEEKRDQDEEEEYLRELREAEAAEEALREANRGKSKRIKIQKPPQDFESNGNAKCKEKEQTQPPPKRDTSIYHHHITEDEAQASAEERTVILTNCPDYFDDNGIRVACRTIYEQYHRENQSHNAKCLYRINFRYNITQVIWANSLFAAASPTASALAAQKSKQRKGRIRQQSSKKQDDTTPSASDHVVNLLRHHHGTNSCNSDRSADSSSPGDRKVGRIAIVLFESKYMPELLQHGFVELEKTNQQADLTSENKEGDDQPLFLLHARQQREKLKQGPYAIVVSAAVFHDDNDGEGNPSTEPTASPQVVGVLPCPAGLDISRLTQIRRRLPKALQSTGSSGYNKNDYFTHAQGKREKAMRDKLQQQPVDEEWGGVHEPEEECPYNPMDLSATDSDSKNRESNVSGDTPSAQGSSKPKKRMRDIGNEEGSTAALDTPARGDACKHCGSEDHLSRRCPVKGSVQQQHDVPKTQKAVSTSRPQQPGSSGDACKHCGSQDHLSRKCPVRAGR